MAPSFAPPDDAPGRSGSVKVWRVSDGKLLSVLDNDMSEVPILSFSDDATLLSCTTGKSRVILWDIPQNKSRWTNSVGPGITSLRFEKQDATVIAECADKSTRRLSMQNGELLRPTQSKGALLYYIKVATCARTRNI